jgi:dTDP-4-dehydrorhamnose reductase
MTTSIIVAKILNVSHSEHAEYSKDSEFPWGTYHLSADGVASWHEFAAAIFVAMNRQTGQKIELPKPILSAAYPIKATRPKNSRLDNNLLSATLGLKLPDWQTQLAWCLDAVKNE